MISSNSATAGGSASGRVSSQDNDFRLPLASTPPLSSARLTACPRSRPAAAAATDLSVDSVREVSENWWYAVEFPLKYGRWGDREPFCFPDATHFQEIIYVDRGLADCIGGSPQLPSRKRVRGGSPVHAELTSMGLKRGTIGFGTRSLTTSATRQSTIDRALAWAGWSAGVALSPPHLPPRSSGRHADRL